MTKDDFEERKDELVGKYYTENAMCKSDLFELLDEYDKLLKTAHNSDYTKSCGPSCPNCGAWLNITLEKAI